MSFPVLNGCRILLVEDEYLLAQDLKDHLEEVQAIVLGPEPSVDDALARIGDEPRIDAAVLDVNLGGERVFPVADALAARDVPFLFASGYGDEIIRERYPGRIRCDKPIDMRRLFCALGNLVHADRG